MIARPPMRCAGRTAGGSRRRRAAFTLVEVVLAVALSIGLVMAALQFYRHVVDVRRLFGDQLDVVQATAARRQLMDKLTDELRGAIVYPLLGYGLSGGSDQVQLMTAGVPGPAVWATGNVTDKPPMPEHDIRMIGYRLRWVEDANGIEYVAGIERTCQTVVAAETAEEGENVTATLIAPQYKFLSLRYWDSQVGDWTTDWQQNSLPMAVEIVVGAEPLPENVEPQDYPYETYRRVVFIPGGAQPLGGSNVIRGPSGGPR